MKIFKWILIVLAVLTAIGFITFYIIDKPLPQGKEGQKAEELADKMLIAINDSSWQATDVVSFNYNSHHHYIWDKKRNWAQVRWDDYKVLINLGTKSGKAWAKDKLVEREELLSSLLEEAYFYWANDSFWLNPISKIRDKGTTRAYVSINNQEEEALLVTYSSGGVTPGDSYLFVVDKNTQLTKEIRMWVSIIPVGGISFTWERYETLSTGAKISTFHDGPIKNEIKNLKAWDSLENSPHSNVFKSIDNL